ncbi:hypothetical protein Dimus_004895 [Dionaea muscipula]
MAKRGRPRRVQLSSVGASASGKVKETLKEKEIVSSEIHAETLMIPTQDFRASEEGEPVVLGGDVRVSGSPVDCTQELVDVVAQDSASSKPFLKPVKSMQDRQANVLTRKPIICSSGWGNNMTLSAEKGDGVWQEVGRKSGVKQMMEDHDQRKVHPVVHTSNRFDDLMSSEILLGKDEMIQIDFMPSTSHDSRCLERKRFE